MVCSQDSFRSVIPPRCAIVAIGTELTIGQVVDTNSSHIAGELYALGCTVCGVYVVPDDRDAMRALLKRCGEEYDVTVVTGGLGPTSDDFTQEVLVSIYGGELRVDGAQLSVIARRLSERGLAMSDRNRRQAFVPSSCTTLVNEHGTAPGMLFERAGRLLFSLPGVPHEMRWLMEHRVRPHIERLARPQYLHRTLRLYGIAESFLADRLAGWEGRVREHFSLAYLPSPEGIRLRLDSLAPATEATRGQLDALTNALRALLPQEFYGMGEDTLPQVVAGLLRARGLTVGTAESCTAGAIGAELGGVPGVSLCYRGTIAAYASDVKVEVLGVPHELLAKCGAVSGEVAEAMAVGGRRLLRTDYAVSTTGLLGPDGDGSGVRVGEVWIACAWAGGCARRCLRVNGERSVNQRRVVYESLNMLRLVLRGVGGERCASCSGEGG